MSADAVVKAVQGGSLEAVEQRTMNHTAFVQSKGLSNGAFYAINGKMIRFQGRQMVRRPCVMSACAGQAVRAHEISRSGNTTLLAFAMPRRVYVGGSAGVLRRNGFITT